ncbi:hypothetical protein H5410_036847 [Solanum commersonii]|uniref:Uncharacterized protein n=1 Tax=Solanum commersonii TaxID=4109 RepID=A0A9J5Y6U1_SOLCO|nr:hypothetical protein H5410_036847 [Solanum commersonii]
MFHGQYTFRATAFEKVGAKFLELELLPPPPSPLLFFLSDIGLLPLVLSKFMFKFKIIKYYEKQAR